MNSTFAQTFSACAYALRALMDKDLPVNHGFYQYVRINAPLGTVTNCVHPAPVVGGWETHVRLNDMISRRSPKSCPTMSPPVRRRCSATPVSVATTREPASTTATLKPWLALRCPIYVGWAGRGSVSRPEHGKRPGRRGGD